MLFQHRRMKLGSIIKNFTSFHLLFVPPVPTKMLTPKTRPWDYSALQFHYGNFHFSITQNYLRQFPAHPKTLIPLCQLKKNKIFFFAISAVTFWAFNINWVSIVYNTADQLTKKGQRQKTAKILSKDNICSNKFFKAVSCSHWFVPKYSRTFIWLTFICVLILVKQAPIMN